MRKYLLTDLGVKARVKTAERMTILLVLSLGLPVLISLFFVLPSLNFVVLIVGLIFLWGTVELISLERRRRIPAMWSEYTIEYEISKLVERRDEIKKVEILRNEIQLICKYVDGLEVHDLDQVIFIPKELEGFDELVVELRKWRPIEQNKIYFSFKPIWDVLVESFSHVGKILYAILSSSNLSFSNLISSKKKEDSKSKRESLNRFARKREVQRRRRRYFSQRNKRIGS